MTFDGSGNASISWDDGSAITFTKSGSSFVAPTGEHGTFVQTQSSSPTLYEYVTVNQVHFVFSSAYGYCLTKIYDRNGNGITINHGGSPYYRISSVVDPTSRTITFTYNNSNQLTQINDPLGRVWTLGYSASVPVGGAYYQPGPDGGWTDEADNYLLQSITLPSPDGSHTYQVGFTYTTATAIPTNLHYTYYPGTIATVTDPNNKITHWYYADTANPGALTSTADPVGISNNITYNSGTQAGSGSTVFTDANGNHATQYYVNGVLDHVVDATGTTTGQYTYDTNNNITVMIDGRNKTWQYAYDSSGTNQTSITDPDNHTTSISYNGFNEPYQILDALTKSTSMGYDSVGNLTNVLDPLSHYSSITYPPAPPSYNYGLPSQSTDAVGNVTSLGYDSNGYLNNVIDPNGAQSSSVYNALGWLQSTTDAALTMTAYTYDNWGRVTHVARGGATQIALYRLDGTPGCASGGAGTDDDLNRIYTTDYTFVTALLGGGWHYEGAPAYIYTSANAQPNLVPLYRLQSGSSAGQSLYVTTTAQVNYFVSNGWANEGIIGYAYPSNVSNTSGLVALYGAWNPNTNRNLITPDYVEYSSLQSPWQQQGIICYLVAQAGSLQTVANYTYDPDSNVIQFSDANGNGYSATYDADNRMLTRTNTRVNGGSNNSQNDTVSYTYDQPNPSTHASEYGLLSWVTNGNGATTTYQYDALNRVVKTTYPDGETSSITSFDGNGNPLTVVDGNGVTTTLTYNNENRVTSKTTPNVNNNVISYPKNFTYDADGRLKTMSDVMGTTTWNYDDAGRTTSVASPNGTVYYGYDNANKPTSRQVGGLSGAWVWGYGGGANGNSPGTRVIATSNTYSEGTSYSYDAAGRLTRRVLANTVYETIAYDDQGRITDITYFPNTSSQIPFEAVHYAYDAGGRIIGRRRGSDGQLSIYAYDGANQLVDENISYQGTHPGFDETFTYDRNGNRLTRSFGSASGLTDSFIYSPGDKLLQVSGGTLSKRNYWYDGNGALSHTTLNDNLWYALTFDYDGRMVTYAPYVNNNGTWTNDPNAGSVWTANRFNGLGLRTQKQDSSGLFPYVTDGTGPGSQVLTDGAAVYSDGVSEHRNGLSKFYSADIVADITDISDSSGTNVTDHIEYDAFGSVLARSGSTPTPFGFGGRAGYQTDGDSGLILVGNRFYDPAVGRFISVDPVAAGDNWYAYCGNCPVSMNDPSGLDGQGADGSGPKPLSNDMGGGSVWDQGNGIGLFKVRPGKGIPLPNGNGGADLMGGEPIADPDPSGIKAGFANLAMGMSFGLYHNEKYYNAPGAGVSRISGGVATVALGFAGGVYVAASRIGVSVIGAATTALGLNGGCFVEGTLIQMADGSTKPIEQIRQGDLVLSRGQDAGADGKVVAARVTHTYQHQHLTTQIVAVTLSSGERIECTDNHPFFVPGKGWLPAGRLALGTLIAPRAGPMLAHTVMGLAWVTSVVRKAAAGTVAATTTVYNFEVEGAHTYFVGSSNGGTWVHNACPPTVDEILAVSSRWLQGNSESLEDAITGHFAKHGDGMTLQEYTDAASQLWNDGQGVKQWGVWNANWDASYYVRIGGEEGYFDTAGNIYTYWKN